ncbi:hypothetical protein FOXYS1_14822 [Fusarium oxysporum]|uniref:Fe2OG dioxygenase domain-containing protein n=1 Tax=Fusarium oxysporum TaxID=5507 RepID=A0A8H4ZQS6_FUSOX|nr:hypothetical protein FOXYS1_14822 [Fusarium oxysporum]
MSPFTSHHEYPPFPEGVDTAPLVSISLAKLEKRDKDELTRLFEASRDLGFFYMDMVGSSLGEKIVQQAENLQVLQKQFFQFPKEEKDVYNAEKKTCFSYRVMETTFPDTDGRPKRNESYNIRKDDLAEDNQGFPVHPFIWKHRVQLLQYTRDCRRATDTILECLEESLGLLAGTLTNLHRFEKRSGDHIRFTQAATIPYDEKRAKGGEHTDFGTLTVLFNWLGGLQIRMPTNGHWLCVKPVPGSAIVNLGDAMVIFTAGILRSNIHRVVPPPGIQSELIRQSLVFFCRPEDDVIIKRLKGGLIDAQPVPDASKCLPEIPSHEFITRRTMGDLKGVYTYEGGLEELEEYTI